MKNFFKCLWVMLFLLILGEAVLACDFPINGEKVFDGGNVTVCEGDFTFENTSLKIKSNTTLIINDSYLNLSGFSNNVDLFNESRMVIRNSEILNSSGVAELQINAYNTSSIGLFNTHTERTFVDAWDNASVNFYNVTDSSRGLSFRDNSSGQINSSSLMGVSFFGLCNVSLRENNIRRAYINPYTYNRDDILVNGLSPLSGGSRLIDNGGLHINISSSNVSDFVFLSMGNKANNSETLLNSTELRLAIIEANHQNFTILDSSLGRIETQGLDAGNVYLNHSVFNDSFYISGSSYFHLNNLSYNNTGAFEFSGGTPVINSSGSELESLGIYSYSHPVLHGDFNIKDKEIKNFNNNSNLTRYYPVYVYKNGTPMDNHPVKLRRETITLGINESVQKHVGGNNYNIRLSGASTNTCSFVINSTEYNIAKGVERNISELGIYVTQVNNYQRKCTFVYGHRSENISDVYLASGVTDTSGYVQLPLTFNVSNYNLNREVTVNNDALKVINITTDTPINVSHNLSPEVVVTSLSPRGNYSSYYGSLFNYSISTKCKHGDCGNLTLTLDPWEKPANKKKPEKPLNSKSKKPEDKQYDVIVEFKGKPLMLKYKELKEEIEKLKEKKSSRHPWSPVKTYDNYKIKKAKKNMHVKVKEHEEKITSKRKDILSKVSQTLNADLKVNERFSNIINGVSVEVDGRVLNELKNLKDTQVAKYVEDVHISREKTILLNESVPVISADDVWKEQDAKGNNITGQNVSIAVIDTGIDYTHEDLGGCLGDGCKVAGGYDFVNNDTDPLDDQGHGTHCAGIAAGNGEFSGVAYNATLYGYKVLDSSGRGSDENVISGIERAMDPNNDSNFSDHVDVISMSLGGSGKPFDAVGTACSNAVEAGVSVVVAAGNSGPSNETIDCPGCNPDVITVGAVHNNETQKGLNSKLFAMENMTRFDSVPFENSANTTKEGVNGTLRYAGGGTSEEFSNLNYSNKIALVERGSVPFDILVANAENASAKGLIVHNNYPGIFKGYLNSKSDIPVISISQYDGERLFNRTREGEVPANISVRPVSQFMADFSSRGPSYIYNKPDVLAPGVQICSARLNGSFSDSLCHDNKHASLSGTSMATPHVAGAVALLKQVHPDWNNYKMKSALSYTAEDIGRARNIQGAGIINVSAAINLSNAPPVAMIRNVEGLRYGYS